MPFPGDHETRFSSLNINFFRHLDRVMELLHNKVLQPTWWFTLEQNGNWAAMYSEADKPLLRLCHQTLPRISRISSGMVSKRALDYGRCDIPYINEADPAYPGSRRIQKTNHGHDYEYCSRKTIRLISSLSRTGVLICIHKVWRPISNTPANRSWTSSMADMRWSYLTFEGNYIDPETVWSETTNVYCRCLFMLLLAKYILERGDYDIRWNPVSSIQKTTVRLL